jgi:hypothetical protein
MQEQPVVSCEEELCEKGGGWELQLQSAGRNPNSN